MNCRGFSLGGKGVIHDNLDLKKKNKYVDTSRRSNNEPAIMLVYDTRSLCSARQELVLPEVENCFRR